MSERLQVKYEVSGPGLRGRKIPQHIAREVFQKWARSGRVKKGFNLRVGFRNPDHATENTRRWKWSDEKGQSLSEIRSTLHLNMWGTESSWEGDEEDEE